MPLRPDPETPARETLTDETYAGEGPITALEAKRRRVKYGALTARQFDDLERLSELVVASAVDMLGPRPWGRTEQSMIRAMARHAREGFVMGEVESWRLTERGAAVLRFAYEHMDSMCCDEEGLDGCG